MDIALALAVILAAAIALYALIKTPKETRRAERASDLAERLTAEVILVSDENYALEQVVRQFAELVAVDERGTTLARGERQWGPVFASASHALGEDLAPLVFVTAEVDLKVPVMMPGESPPG